MYAPRLLRAARPSGQRAWLHASAAVRADMVTVEVDGKSVEVEKGTTVITACEKAGATIPRFCYHEKLSIAGNCRMCLVEVVGGPPKPLASCAVSVMPNMKIRTDSEMVKKAREGVMEFLLVNHPLDCPICDQGGECDLQDQAMAFGSDRSRFTDMHKNGKRAVEDKNIGPLVKTIMTRCIQCTRCVRFGEEVAGVEVLGTTGRGNDLQIGTYVEKMIDSELSGNIIDLCPVGALTNKPYSFNARPWELRKTDTIDIFDAVGSNTRVDSRGTEVLRVVPRQNDDVNESWISDKARYAYDGLKRQRITAPMVKRANGRYEKVAWDEALAVVAEQLNKTNGKDIAGIVGGMVDAEAMVALKDLLNRRDAEQLVTESTFPNLGTGVDLRSSYLFNSTINGIEDSDMVLLIGTNPRYEAAILNSRIRRTWMHNEAIVAVVGEKIDANYEYEHLGTEAKVLELLVAGKHPFSAKFHAAKNPIVIVGQKALSRKDARSIVSLSRQLADLHKDDDGHTPFNILHTEASQVAAMDIGYKPTGITGSPSFVYNIGADAGTFSRADLRQDAFVVYQGHHGDHGARMADVILPGAAFTEKNGTFLNTEGRVQETNIAVTPPGDGRQDWQIVRALSEVAGLTLPYDSLLHVRHRLGEISPVFGRINTVQPANFFSIAAQLGVSKETVTSEPLTAGINSLKDFYMTDAVSRSSQTMAKCIRTWAESKGGKPVEV